MDFQILKSNYNGDHINYTLGIKTDSGMITLPEYYISLWDDKELTDYNFAEIDNLGFEQEKRYNIDFPENFITELMEYKDECSYNSGKWTFKISKDSVVITKYEYSEYLIRIESKRTLALINNILVLMNDIKKNMIAMMNYNAIKCLEYSTSNDNNEELKNFNEFKYVCPEYKEFYQKYRRNVVTDSTFT